VLVAESIMAWRTDATIFCTLLGRVREAEAIMAMNGSGFATIFFAYKVHLSLGMMIAVRAVLNVGFLTEGLHCLSNV
jgi:hypothetical protein